MAAKPDATVGHDDALSLPALRAHLGDWIYYITFMTMEDIANRVSIAADIHSSASLRDLLQRQLTNRSQSIADYLIKQKQRFFNALVVATYGGTAEWNEIVLRTPPQPFDLPSIEGVLGLLNLSGSQKFFAVDGQHRVAGIQEAIAQRPALSKEEVCVILVHGISQEHRSADATGFERTRRLFTTLNRYAKPVSKRDIIALDEDDVVAIVTRRLAEEHLLFRDKISSKLATSIPPTDTTSFTAITTIYDALNIFLPLRKRGWPDLKKLRPPDDEIARYYKRSVALWDALANHYPPLAHMRDSQPSEHVAGQYRGDAGGHLLFRPVGLLITIRVLKRLLDAGWSLNKAMSRLSLSPTDIAAQPWSGVLWDPVNRRMLTTREHQRAAEKLLLYMTGARLGLLKSSPQKLRTELAGILNEPVEDVSLPSVVPHG